MSANCFSLWGLRPPDLLLGLRPWTQLGTFAPEPLGYSPQMKILGAIQKDPVDYAPEQRVYRQLNFM